MVFSVIVDPFFLLSVRRLKSALMHRLSIYLFVGAADSELAAARKRECTKCAKYGEETKATILRTYEERRDLHCLLPGSNNVTILCAA